MTQSSEEQTSRVGQGANAYTAEGKYTRDDILPLPPTEGEALTPDVKEIVEALNGFQFRVSMADWATLSTVRQALLRLAGELAELREKQGAGE